MAIQKTAQFKAVLAYILQQANIEELEILTAAIKQRTRTAAGNEQFSAPGAMAQQISRSITQSLNANMEGMRISLRKYAAEIIVKEAPEIPKETLSLLLDSWIPSGIQPAIQKIRDNTAGNFGTLPPQALYEMVLQFVSYSLGEMEQAEYRELSASMGNWTARYWKAFPAAIKREIKAFLTGSITAGTFRRTLQTILTAAEEAL
ncbi:MAG: hypothetical protein ACTTH8_00760 [Treponema sp.]